MEVSGATTGTMRRRMFISARVTSALTSCRVWVGFNTGTDPISWVPLPVGAFLVGGVSQSAGTPTGAVIERSSNANGEYVRFADGTQICTHGLSTSASAAVSWVFPAAFAGNTRMTGMAEATVLSCVMAEGPPSATSVLLSAQGSDNTRRADFIRLNATGRWF